MKVQGWIAMPAASSCDMRGRIAGPGTSLPFKSWFGQPHVGEPPGLLSCSARTSPRPSTPSQTLSSANGAGPDVMISTRSAGLLIDTVVCLTLAKWETVSGRFGGYLRWTACCNGQDCKPVEVTVLPNGNYYLPATNEIIPADMATPSPDERFHHCIYYPVANEFDPSGYSAWSDTPVTRCFFAPMHSS